MSAERYLLCHAQTIEQRDNAAQMTTLFDGNLHEMKQQWMVPKLLDNKYAICH